MDKTTKQILAWGIAGAVGTILTTVAGIVGGILSAKQQAGSQCAYYLPNPTLEQKGNNNGNN